MSGISESLRARLHDIPNIELMTDQFLAGRRVFSLNGTIVATDPLAWENEIVQEIRKAFNMPEEATSEKLPVPAIVEPETVQEKPVEKPAGRPIPSSGSYQPGSLKTLLQGLRDRQGAVMAEAVENVGMAHKALDQVAKIGADAKATAEAIKAELGQFTNFPDDE